MTIIMVLATLVLVALVLPSGSLLAGALRRRGRGERVLILGTGALAAKLVHELEERPDLGCTILGAACEAGSPDVPAARRFLLWSPEDLLRLVVTLRVERIVVAPDERRGLARHQELLEAKVRGVAIEPGEEFYERLTGKVPIESLTPASLVFCRELRMSHLHLALSQTLSVLVSAAALVAFAPLLAVIAAAIRLDSRGPVLFVQERVGRHGQRFRLLKFRTMYPARGETSEWEQDNGHRITRVGRWLRRCRLDELPQLVNVLRGEMNLVGPRPHPASNFALLSTVARNVPECGMAIPYYSLRTLIRPGITGWAQVRYGYANGVEEEIEKLRYDLYYVKHLSLALDFRILLETLRVVLRGHESEASNPHEAAVGLRRSSWDRNRAA